MKPALLKAETTSVSPDEDVLRRIHRAHVKLSDSEPVQRVAFQPNDQDTDGISVYRVACGATPVNVDKAGRRPGEYYVAELSVRALISLGLSVQPYPLPPVPGHAVVPELRCQLQSTTEQKQRAKELQRHLAKIANSCLVLHPASGSTEA